jgi:hypothetical protein
MAAPKGKEKKDQLFNEILIDISENGKSAIAAIKGRMSTQTFFDLLNDDEKSKRYARACEMRAEVIASETIDISDSVKGTDVNRDRLRVDTRKWLLAKLHPKKYGDKLDIEHSGGITLHFDTDDKQA